MSEDGKIVAKDANGNEIFSRVSDFAGVAQLLDESGAPVGDRQLVLNSAAMANLRGKQSVLFKVNEAGTADMLRNGMTDRVQNFALRYSGGIRQHVAGGGSGYVLNGAAAAGLKGLALKTGTSIMQIVNSNAMLLDAEPMSIFNAACMAATLNLPVNNNLGFAYIVPYRNKGRVEAQFQLGYKLIMFLARTGVSPVGESLYQSEQVQEEAIDLVADIIENALKFTEKEVGK